MSEKNGVIGYLPNEKPSIGKTIVFAFQQFLVMLPATVLAALLMKFNIPTAIFASGVATLVFLLVTKGKIPLYYGSSGHCLLPDFLLRTHVWSYHCF